MKKLMLTICFLTLLAITGFSQHAINAIDIAAVDYVEVAHNANGSLDINSGFTIETWMLTGSAQSNQKVAGKIGGDFKNGFILGIQDGQVNCEVFDASGTQTVLQVGLVPDTTWTHIAATYEVGGMLSVYVNGLFAGETTASTNTHNSNNSPFRIGIAPWDVNALGFFGYIDEVRYWNAVLEEGAIRNWIHKDVDNNHPNFSDLGLYHKYDEGTAEATVDHSGSGNDGTLLGAEWLASTVPFKGTFDLYENDVRGVWFGQNNASSDILTLTGNGITSDQSVVFANSDEGYGFTTAPSSGFEKVLATSWKVTTQQETMFPTLGASFDLSPIDLTDVTNIVLLRALTPDFADPTGLTGSMTGNTFLVPAAGDTYTDGAYFTLAFNGAVSNKNPNAHNINFTIFPNPSEGHLQLIIENADSEQMQIVVTDLIGKVVFQKSIAVEQEEYTDHFDFSDLEKGVYLFQLEDGEKVGTKKIVID